MKKVIDGALYSTETAKEIGFWSNDLSSRDFGWCRETLHRTKSGKHFIHGEGGARSRYAQRYGDMWGNGESIVPLSHAEAMTWAEENLTADEYAAEFGEPEEAADDRVALNITVPPGVKRKLESMRSESGKSISQIITETFS